MSAAQLRLQGSNRPNDFVILGKPSLRVFRKQQLAVHRDIENPAVSAGQFRLDPQFALERGRQTGGLREVVSTTAVLDRDLHRLMLAQPCTVRQNRRARRRWGSNDVNQVTG
jgi:hypothetical protein